MAIDDLRYAMMMQEPAEDLEKHGLPASALFQGITTRDARHCRMRHMSGLRHLRLLGTPGVLNPFRLKSRTLPGTSFRPSPAELTMATASIA